METARRANGKSSTGVQDLISAEEFDEAMRRMAADVMRAINIQKPGSSVILEKTPHHVLHVPLILRIFPAARFIHLIRDPRSIVASLRASASGWGAHWAESGAIAGAERWRVQVAAGLDIPSMTDRYEQIYYEDLRSATAENLLRLFQWLEIPADADMCADFTDQASIGALRAGTGAAALTPTSNAKEFYRHGTATGWRSELRAVDIAAIESETGALMTRLGYDLVSRKGMRNRMLHRPRAHCRRALRRTAGAMRWRLNRILKRLENAL